jgi:hypothetical protein
MTIEELRRTKREEIIQVATKHGASNIRIFGSLAREENSPASDIDILVDLEPGRSLFDLGGLLTDLQSLLHAQVDVSTERMLRPKVRERALRDAIPL